MKFLYGVLRCEMLSIEDFERIQKENKDKFVIDLQHLTIGTENINIWKALKKFLIFWEGYKIKETKVCLFTLD